MELFTTSGGCTDLYEKIRSIQRKLRGHDNLAEAIQECDECGWTTLHYAALMAQHKIVRTLLKKGADVNKPTAEGLLPLSLAAISQDTCTIRVILDYKPQINSQDRNLDSPLLHFIKFGGSCERSLKLLLKAGADPNLADMIGRSPLDLVAESEKIEQVAAFTCLLIHYNANLNKRFNSFYNCIETPLNQAIYYGSETMVRILLENCAFVDGNLEMKTAFFCSSCNTPSISELVTKQYILQNKCKKMQVDVDRAERFYKMKNMEQFQIECDEELLELKRMKVADSRITYYDILVDPSDRIAKYLRNPNILDALRKFDSDKYKFGRFIRDSFRKGLTRLKASMIGYRFLRKSFPQIADICIYSVIDLLSNENLFNLK